MGSREVVSVGRSASAYDLAIDLRAARLGMLVLLQDQRTGALADYEAVAVLIEGAP